jgi:chromosome segregation ATPase
MRRLIGGAISGVSIVKRFIKRVGGLAALAIGLTGAVLSVLAVNQAWVTAERLSREIPEMIGHLEAITNSTSQQGEATVALLGTARERIQSINATLEELSDTAGDKPVNTTILDTLEEDLGQRLETAEQFVASIQNSMRSMSSALLLLESIPFFAPRVPRGETPRESQLGAVAINLVETADLLDQVTRNIARVRAGQSIPPRQLAQLQGTIEQIDHRLQSTQSEIQHFSLRVELTGNKLSKWKEDALQWIDRSVAIASLFLVCFGCSQISLLLHGWQLLLGRL